jgi:hypothetical protein
MAAATKAEIEKVVRKVLDDQNGANGATLEAIQRVSRLLTEKVIPNLVPGLEGEEAAAEDEDETMGVATPGAQARRRASPRLDDDLDTEVVEGEDDDLAAATDVSPAVTEAVETVCRTLSPGQADALADLFTAMGSQLGEGEEGGEEDEDVDDGEDGVDGANGPARGRGDHIPGTPQRGARG